MAKIAALVGVIEAQIIAMSAVLSLSGRTRNTPKMARVEIRTTVTAATMYGIMFDAGATLVMSSISSSLADQ